MTSNIRDPSTAPIRPHPDTPRYWQYNGAPVVLLGGSWQDNLFNHPIGLEKHLDRLVEAGGNYVRNTMSHRNRGNVFAYEESDERFDLDRFNDEYWDRLESFLALTYERDVIVQIEVWATWDCYEDHQSLGGWSHHPFNPTNNVNYTSEASRLPTAVDYPPEEQSTEHPFFRTVPALADNELVRSYQEAYVDALLNISLEFPHVLYCMNNETGEELAWGEYWVEFIRERAAARDVPVHTTDMRRSADLTSDDHAYILERPDRYTFLDISQNNAGPNGRDHFANIRGVYGRTADYPRPINNVKNYGGTFHGDTASIARFCRIVFAGGASARFHRPHPLEDPTSHEAATEIGLGLSETAQHVVRSMRTVVDTLDVTTMAPRNELLDADRTEAYVLADDHGHVAVYFTDGGTAELDASSAAGERTLGWLDVEQAEHHESRQIRAGDSISLSAPDDGHWVALLTE